MDRSTALRRSARPDADTEITLYYPDANCYYKKMIILVRLLYTIITEPTSRSPPQLVALQKQRTLEIHKQERF